MPLEQTGSLQTVYTQELISHWFISFITGNKAGIRDIHTAVEQLRCEHAVLPVSCFHLHVLMVLHSRDRTSVFTALHHRQKD